MNVHVLISLGRNEKSLRPDPVLTSTQVSYYGSLFDHFWKVRGHGKAQWIIKIGTSEGPYTKFQGDWGGGT